MSASAPTHRPSLPARIVMLVRAIQEDDQLGVEAVIKLSRSRRVFAPLAFTVGGVAMLLDGLRLLLSNWRLLAIQVLPAVWIWLAMYDLKAHVLHGRSFNTLRGPVLIPIVLAILAITAACFFLNAVFAFAVTGSRPPRVRPGFTAAKPHARTILAWGAGVGLLLGVSTTISPRWGPPWFALSLGIVIGVMMVCYVAVPSRIVGVKKAKSKRDKLAASALSGMLSAMVCTPPYLLGRVGILMLGSKALVIPGVIVLVVGFTLQAGATGAVRAIKMSVSLTAGEGAAGDRPAVAVAPAGDGPASEGEPVSEGQAASEGPRPLPSENR